MLSPTCLQQVTSRRNFRAYPSRLWSRCYLCRKPSRNPLHPLSLQVFPSYLDIDVDIGGNALDGNVPISQLAKGFHASFWFGFGCSVVAAVLAMTLKIGTRGHKGETDMREISLKQHTSQNVTSPMGDIILSTGNDINTEIIQSRGITPSTK